MLIMKFFKEIYMWIKFPSHQYWDYKDRYWTKSHVVKKTRLTGWTTTDRILSHHILQIADNFIFKTCEADKNYKSEFVDIQDHPEVPKMWNKLTQAHKWLSEHIDKDFYDENMENVERPKFSFIKIDDKFSELAIHFREDGQEEKYENAMAQIGADERRNKEYIRMTLKNIIDCMWLMEYLC